MLVEYENIVVGLWGHKNRVRVYLTIFHLPKERNRNKPPSLRESFFLIIQLCTKMSVICPTFANFAKKISFQVKKFFEIVMILQVDNLLFLLIYQNFPTLSMSIWWV